MESHSTGSIGGDGVDTGMKVKVWYGSSVQFHEEGRFAILEKYDIVIVAGWVMDKRWATRRMQPGQSLMNIRAAMDEYFKGVLVVWGDKRA